MASTEYHHKVIHYGAVPTLIYQHVTNGSVQPMDELHIHKVPMGFINLVFERVGVVTSKKYYELLL